jgi:hypothetical protein
VVIGYWAFPAQGINLLYPALLPFYALVSNVAKKLIFQDKPLLFDATYPLTSKNSPPIILNVNSNILSNTGDIW